MPSVVRIGDLTIDPVRQRLARGAGMIHLGPRTWKLLLALIEAAPNVATHDALADSVWDGRAVSPETVSQRVKLLRDAIGDHASHPRYIELVRGRGYRLLPPVEVVEDLVEPHRWRRGWVAGAILVVALLAVGRLHSPDPAVPPAKSIAVLPFADMSPEQDQEYLADGIAEEILNLLARTTSMRVIARTSSFSFRGRSVDIPTIAQTLDVTHVLEGSIRKSGDRVRITVQLVNGADGGQVWSDSYDREMGDMLILQTEIAASIASALQVNWLDPDRAAATTPVEVDPEAFDAYLRGMRALRYPDESYDEAEGYLQDAIRTDPEFIRAYSQLGLVYVLQVVTASAEFPENREKLRALVERGLALAPDDAALIGLSGQVAAYDRDIELAERRLKQALAIDPSNIPVRYVYGMMKLDQGQPREALKIDDRLLELDPLNPHNYIHRWACHLDLWNAKEAIAAGARYQDIAMPTDALGLTLSGHAKMMLSGDFIGMMRDYEKAVAIWYGIAERAYAPPLYYYFVDDIETGDAAFDFYRQRSGTGVTDGPFLTMTIAYRHVLMGEIAEARQLAVPALLERRPLTGMESDIVLSRLAFDELIARGKAARGIEVIEQMAPIYKSYRLRPHIPPEDFSPAPTLVKSAYSSFPAPYFPDYIRLLSAIGDKTSADNMLNHLEAILQLRRKRGLFIEERYAAEAAVLRGDTNAALDALEQAERDRTLYPAWRLFLLHNEILGNLREQPRFVALVDRVETEISRQRAALTRDGPL